MEINLPNNWSPRHYQMPLWGALESGIKRAVVCWPRRAGKDDLCLHWSAIQCMTKVGNYIHCLPQANQARRAIWDAVNPHTGRRRIDEAFPEAIRASVRTDEMKITFVNGSTWQVVGSDNYSALIGSAYLGVVFSEYALSNPNAYAFLRPILAENGGWALFISTPRGRNHFHKLFLGAEKSDGWFAEHLSAETTGHIKSEVLANELAEMIDERGEEEGKALYEQEYLCSWDAAIPGAYYSRLLATATKENRITNVPYDPAFPVYTAWDLGIGDSTAIWFAQMIGREMRIIDFYEASGVGLDHYAKIIKDKTYSYERHILPHDVMASELGTGTTRYETLRKLGIRAEALPASRVDDGISAVRMMLPRCWFDKTKCEKGLNALAQYQREWDEKAKAYKPRPLHDWTSHASDAFRYLAVGTEKYRPEKRERNKPRMANTDYNLFG